MGTQYALNLPSHTARSPVKSPYSSGGIVALASSEMRLPDMTRTSTAPSGKAHFAAAYCRAIGPLVVSEGEEKQRTVDVAGPTTPTSARHRRSCPRPPAHRHRGLSLRPEE